MNIGSFQSCLVKLQVFLILSLEIRFSVNVSKKGIYYDGHERPDVILSRGKFADEFNYWREKCVKFDDETLKATNEDAAYIMASLDQKAHHSNDVIKR